jgi:hypothetical protein
MNVPAEMMDLLELAKEELDPELVPWLDESESFGQVLRHPLVVHIGVIPGLANRAFRAKTEALEIALSRQDWHAAVFLHERAYRNFALIEYVVGTDENSVPLPLYLLDDDTRALAGHVWTDSENLDQYEAEWRAMLTAPAGHGLVLCDDPQGWAALPDTLTVYRGDCPDGGLSWSLDPKVAQFFATRFDARHPLLTGTVAKADVVGYLAGRSESEVLILRDDAVRIG